MKTAISIPDQLFQAAEQYAKSHGVTRSNLYSHAVAQFLKKHSRDQITQKLNEVYSDQPTKINKTIYALQLSSLEKEEW
jgi:metal-responsive CopG/Arc/MetJ family transcriptional regulator